MSFGVSHIGENLVATNGVIEEIESNDISKAIKRFAIKDWGDDVCKEDWNQNDLMLIEKGMILGSYLSSKGIKFWIITDAGHEVTTVLLPSEY